MSAPAYLRNAVSAPQTAEAVGYIDSLGFLRCSRCASKHRDSCYECRTVEPFPVYRNTLPEAQEPCDSCGRRLSEERA